MKTFGYYVACAFTALCVVSFLAFLCWYEWLTPYLPTFLRIY